jgi:hypothetical protein
MSISVGSSNANNFLPQNQRTKTQAAKRDARAGVAFSAITGVESESTEQEVDASLIYPPPPEDFCDQSAIDDLWNELQVAIRSAKK